MNIWEIDKFLNVLLFIIPGFISLKFYELFFPYESVDSQKQIIEVITYSCINYALLFWAILSIENNDIYHYSQYLYYLFYLFLLFIAPIFWVCLWRKLRTSKLFQKTMPHPTHKAWDYVFSQRKPYWIIITLKNGSKIGGKYSNKSFTSSSPSDEQIYLEEHWVINKYNGFERKRIDTEGILVLSKEIVTIEYFKMKE